MFLHVLEARYLGDYRVWLRFSDGTSGEVDLSGELDGPVFGPLRDVELFKRFTTHHLLWPGRTALTSHRSFFSSA